MKTSSFKKVEKLNLIEDPNFKLISISRYLLPFKRNKFYEKHLELAPAKEWYQESKSWEPVEYAKHFQKVLDKLNPEEVWKSLHDTQRPIEPVLICYEEIPDKLRETPAIALPKEFFCHRRLVAEWFEKELGYKVEELKKERR